MNPSVSGAQDTYIVICVCARHTHNCLSGGSIRIDKSPPEIHSYANFVSAGLFKWMSAAARPATGIIARRRF